IRPGAPTMARNSSRILASMECDLLPFIAPARCRAPRLDGRHDPTSGPGQGQAAEMSGAGYWGVLEGVERAGAAQRREVVELRAPKYPRRWHASRSGARILTSRPSSKIGGTKVRAWCQYCATYCIIVLRLGTETPQAV